MELCQILFADDTALLVDSKNKLQKLVEGYVNEESEYE